jgi:hypothetical protein
MSCAVISFGGLLLLAGRIVALNSGYHVAHLRPCSSRWRSRCH